MYFAKCGIPHHETVNGQPKERTDSKDPSKRKGDSAFSQVYNLLINFASIFQLRSRDGEKMPARGFKSLGHLKPRHISTRVPIKFQHRASECSILRGHPRLLHAVLESNVDAVT